MAKRKKRSGKRRSGSRKRVSGITNDITSVGGGIVVALIADMLLTKVVGGHHGGGEGEMPMPENPEQPYPVQGVDSNPVMSAIEGIGRATGMPKGTIVKGAAALAFIVIADKMPQYRTGALISASILGYQAITELPMVGRHLHGGMHGLTLGEINDRMQQAVEEYKEKVNMEAVEAIEGSPYDATGQRIAGVTLGNPFY